MKSAKEVAETLVVKTGLFTHREFFEQALVAYAREAFEEAARATADSCEQIDEDSYLSGVVRLVARAIRFRAKELLGEESK